MFGLASHDRARDLAVARETAQWWHAAAQRERERADLAEEQAKLAQDRLWRLTEALVRAAQRASGASAPSGDATEAPQAPVPVAVPPQVASAVERMAGKSAIVRQKFHEWLYRPDIAKRWASGDPAQVKGVVDEICRGKQ